MSLPLIKMQNGQDRRLRAGHPWAFANELQLDAAARALAPGSLVTLAGADGRPLGTAGFNLHSLIAARLYDRQPDRKLDASFFHQRLAAALALRDRLHARPHYRLVHAEGDNLPGFIVDRYGDVLTVQANTASAEQLTPVLLAALTELLRPRAIVLRNDSSIRALEGLDEAVRLAQGELDGPVEVLEGDCRFPVDPLAGQKTGWFFDLAPARQFMARLARGTNVLDLYCHTGAFAVQAAAAGATRVDGLDRSEAAIALAGQAAEANGVGRTCQFRRAEVFAALEQWPSQERYGCVIADPPSFVKSRKELAVGARGYRKLARLVAPRVAPGGFLFIASCSHHMPVDQFAVEVAAGLATAGRTGRIIAAGGAGPDHPVHPQLPESAYLKYQILQLD